MRACLAWRCPLLPLLTRFRCYRRTKKVHHCADGGHHHSHAARGLRTTTTPATTTVTAVISWFPLAVNTIEWLDIKGDEHTPNRAAELASVDSFLEPLVHIYERQRHIARTNHLSDNAHQQKCND